MFNSVCVTVCVTFLRSTLFKFYIISVVNTFKRSEKFNMISVVFIGGLKSDNAFWDSIPRVKQMRKWQWWCLLDSYYLYRNIVVLLFTFLQIVTRPCAKYFIIVCTCMFKRNYCDSLLPSTVCSVLSYVRTSWCSREFHSHFVCSIPTPSAEVPLHLDLPFTSAKNALHCMLR